MLLLQEAVALVREENFYDQDLIMKPGYFSAYNGCNFV